MAPTSRRRERGSLAIVALASATALGCTPAARLWAGGGMVAVGGIVAAAGAEQALDSCSGGSACAHPNAARNAAIVGVVGLAVGVVGAVILLRPDAPSGPSTFVPAAADAGFPDH